MPPAANNPPGTRTLLGVPYKPSTTIYILVLVGTGVLCVTYLGLLNERQGVLALVGLSLAMRFLGRPRQ